MSDTDNVEETEKFMPKFDNKGLIPCVTTSAYDNSVLMVAYMNDQAIALSLQTGEAHYWSRSRQEIWHKGATSGNVQKIASMKTDCDQDCILLSVKMPMDDHGEVTACHTGRKSCFYRELKSENGTINLIKT